LPQYDIATVDVVDVGRHTASMSAVIHGLRLMWLTSAVIQLGMSAIAHAVLLGMLTVAHVVLLVYGYELFTTAEVDGWP
jgi:hypothetical protein